MIECAICHKEMYMITDPHLRLHGITMPEYRKTYPDAQITSEETLRNISNASRTMWANSTPDTRKARLNSIWITRRATGMASGSLKGKTYEEIHGVEKAEELRQARRSSQFWTNVTYEERIKYAILGSHKAALLQETDPAYQKRRAQSLSKGVKSYWDNVSAADKKKRIHLSIQSLNIKPNKAELGLHALLNRLFPNEWEYVGDGALIIGGKCPDFANINGRKQLIELFGDYWHRGEDPTERVNIFKLYGFQCLVIWERELKNPTELAWKLLAYARRKS